MKRYVIDDTGGQFFVCDDLDAANTKCDALVAEGRDAYVAHGDAYAEIKKVESQAEAIILQTHRLLDAVEEAAAGLTGPKVRGDEGYSHAYAKVYELRQKADTADALKAELDALRAELDIMKLDLEEKISRAGAQRDAVGNGRADESGPTYDNPQVDPSMTAEFKHVGGAPETPPAES